MEIIITILLLVLIYIAYIYKKESTRKCPKCGKPMFKHGIIKRTGDNTRITVFRCKCGEFLYEKCTD